MTALSGSRLWAPLSRPDRRQVPAKGMDIFGEFIAGAMVRWRARKPDWIRAKAIAAEARQISNKSDESLDELVSDVRTDSAVRPDDPRVIDRAFAAGYEVIRREVGLTLHVEQVLGALALAAGSCAELATGEGKTVTAILPAALRAWRGRGMHVVTVNDYLARRDAETTAPAFRRLGLTLGVIQEHSTPAQRQAAYACGVTYSSDKQVIFDHLRDRLVSPVTPRLTGLLLDDVLQEPGAWGGQVVQRGLEAAIVDEADSVLIDEAVTPAIISGPGGGEDAWTHVRLAVSLVGRFNEGTHYTIRERTVRFTPAGREMLEALAESLPAFWRGPNRREELMALAITAERVYHRGEDYVVRGNTLEIIDRSTGRVLPGRQWQLGLHQAVEAKEGLKPSQENVSLARISYQQFFQKYRHLAGMTGTAREVAGELWRWYRLPVVSVPTHKRVIRVREPERVLATEAEKLEAAADRAAEASGQGRPVLVGTWSVTTSERMAAMLRRRGVGCSVLNADREAEEAKIIERAGLAGAVTVATNMAGRGTDIRLSEDARKAGGLLVVATERHDERRVDRQLEGRAARQGDPGGVARFLSFEDRLIAQHGWKPLVNVAKRGGRMSRGAAKLAWKMAQRGASARWRAVREDAAKAEAFFTIAWRPAGR